MGKSTRYGVWRAACEGVEIVVFPDTPMLWTGIGLTLGAAILVGCVGTVSAALLLRARSVREYSRQEGDSTPDDPRWYPFGR